ncbi:MAG: hypothetical protein GY742_02195 [Hyphomicrobiales bacterium]|nr:hypothetical protein [Hyphomicrobiales bacterium]
MHNIRSLFFAVGLALLLAGEVASQQRLEVDAIVEELAEVAAFVNARSALTQAPNVEVPNNGRLVIRQRIFSADVLSLGAGSELMLDTSQVKGEAEFFVVARKLIVPTGANLAKIGWVGDGSPSLPPALGRAANGTNGKGAGQDGNPGLAGRQGKLGFAGVTAPRLTIIVLEIVGDAIQVDLSGGNGGQGGMGQAGGHGGNGARGNSARTAWVKFPFGGKTAAGCAAGPGRGGRGGNAGPGGQGGIGGNAGTGGTFRFVGPAEVAEIFFETGEILVSPGKYGAGGEGGEAGRPGQGGQEGRLSSHCGSAGRQGSPGSNAPGGQVGPNGQEASEGTVSRIDLDAKRLVRAFGFGADDD